ncbi:hypothetical protein BDV93DRAFT_549612 [Ceratobasidium sp. AG-I]|nr:hypothetical protein BDV93DRAFT_549612 [Ceratobasidium sp. AG-I]
MIAFPSNTRAPSTQNTIWCLVYGNDPIAHRFKVKVGNLDMIDVCDLKDMIMPYATTTPDQGPAFKLRLYQASYNCFRPGGFSITQEFKYPEHKLSRYWPSADFDGDTTMHILVVLPASYEKFKSQVSFF